MYYLIRPLSIVSANRNKYIAIKYSYKEVSRDIHLVSTSRRIFRSSRKNFLPPPTLFTDFKPPPPRTVSPVSFLPLETMKLPIAFAIPRVRGILHTDARPRFHLLFLRLFLLLFLCPGSFPSAPTLPSKTARF